MPREIRAVGRPQTAREPRIMVHVVAYNAVSTLGSVLNRIPPSLKERLTEICVFDDHSPDDTFLVGEGYRAVHDVPNLRVFRNPKNLGYGGNQKVGYRYAIDNGFDFVVLLHGDGQYAPECMEDILRPLIAGEADAVFGSRMMERGGALRGGMPLYKFVGNKILSRLENAMLGMELSEFHSGYRAYSVKALEQIPFEANTDDFHFDTQIIIQLKAGGFRIKEVPIPTYYGDEICHVNGIRYAKDVMRAVFDFRRHKAGLISRPEYAHVQRPRYEQKESPFSSHQRIIEAVKPGSKVLDVGCASGYIARALKAKGCTVIGVDLTENEDNATSCDRFYRADLEKPWEPEERDFDYILYADVLEHLRSVDILTRSRSWLAQGGRIIASTSNVALWYMRLSLLLGSFDYTPRGILDETHVKLYNREHFRRLFTQNGFDIVGEDWTVIPTERLLESVFKGGVLAKTTYWIEQLSYQLARAWPEMMAYQFLVQAEAKPTPVRDLV
jgi:glycosyltransferase involved in cell wall biosynthesis